MKIDEESEPPLLAVSIRVCGQVQGVGFRPFVFRLAQECGVKGEVGNDGNGVYIKAWANPQVIDSFVEKLIACPLPLARVKTVERTILHGSPAPPDFKIGLSLSGRVSTGVPPDAASCAECLREVFDRNNRRYRYPFTNCTHCGPRLSIIKAIPYDRESTSMCEFPMCRLCRSEYEDPFDRRFHAQPNACSACGPRLELLRANDDGSSTPLSHNGEDLIYHAARLIEQGEIVAVKGLGGFQLVCRADLEDVVSRLRTRKKRFKKAFALMARDIAVVERYCRVTDLELQLLQSSAAPIVIMEKFNELAPSIAPGQYTLACMLAYTPLHHLLLKDFETPLVCTSGNLSDEPQCISNSEALERLSAIADYILSHNREIVNRVDDSVAAIKAGGARILRRARGYAPESIDLPDGFESACELLAMGAELKNTFCLVKGGRAVVSQHIGDLEDARTFADYKTSIELYKNLFQSSPEICVVDLHPEYLSTKFGKEISATQGLELLEVQHHHAHIASCLAENKWAINNPPVLGIAFDGLGMGEGQELWGGEFLLADYMHAKRLACLKPAALIGGSMAMKEPWRNTYAQINSFIGWNEFKAEFAELELTEFLEGKPLATFDSMLCAGFNVPQVSSCGRLFDAVAAALGVCRQFAYYEGQAACELEAVAMEYLKQNPQETSSYDFAFVDGKDGLSYLDPAPMWKGLFANMKAGSPLGLMALRFHNGLAQAVVKLADRLCRLEDSIQIDTIVLTGGVMQNKLLLESLFAGLESYSYRVLLPSRLPANDGGISFGQSLVGSARIKSKGAGDNVSWYSRQNS